MSNILHYTLKSDYRKKPPYCEDHKDRGDRCVVTRRHIDLDWWLTRNLTDAIRNANFINDSCLGSIHLERAIFRNELNEEFFREHVSKTKCPSCLSETLLKTDNFFRDRDALYEAINKFDSQYGSLWSDKLCDALQQVDDLESEIWSEIGGVFDLYDEEKLIQERKKYEKEVA